MKKKIKSLITDDLFEPDNDPKVNLFGNFRIIGDIELIAVCKNDSFSIDLYYNHHNKKFFIVMKYSSGKFWVQTFMFKMIKMNDLDDLDNIQDRVISKTKLEDSDRNVLKYDDLDYLFTYINDNSCVYYLRRI